MIPLNLAMLEYREKARRDHATLLYAAVQEGEVCTAMTRMIEFAIAGISESGLAISPSSLV